MQILEKKILAESEKKIFDEAEKIIKGKPVKPSPSIDPTYVGATGILGAPLPAGGQRYAVLVGLANYPGIAHDLCVADAKTGKDFPTINDGLAQYCKDQDALNMKKALIEKYGYNEGNIFLFSDANAKFDAIKSKIDELVNGVNGNLPILKAEDELVFFFSGHSSTGVALDETGAQLNDDEETDEAMFIYDQNYSEADFLNGIVQAPGNSSYIWDDQLRAWFENSPTKRIVFTFDTCSAGGMNDLESEGRVLALSSTEFQSSYTYYLGGYNSGTLESPIYKESEGLFAHYFVRRGMIDGLGDGVNALNKKNVLKYDGKVVVEEAFGYAKPIIATKQAAVLSDKFYNDLLLGY